MRKQRHGFTFVELLVAVVVLAALLTTSVQMLRLVAEQRQRNDDRLAAIEVASSVMELITASPDVDLGPDALQQPAVQSAVASLGSRWKIDLHVIPVAEEPAGQRIELQLTRSGARANERPLTLTAWRYH